MTISVNKDNIKKVYFKTFGCRTNIYDTALMQNNVENFIVVNNENQADIIIINSCTVTNNADNKLNTYVNKQNNKKIFITGCAANTKGVELLQKNQIFATFGQSNKNKINDLLAKENKFNLKGNLSFIDNQLVINFINKSRAFIKIQEGCNFHCSYCIIPSVRGKARSQNEDKIILQIKNLTQIGFSEFILTGTNIGSYGKDSKSSLPKLLKKISKITAVKRIRLGSIEPVQINDEFIELLTEPWLEKHLHIALQYTNEKMLKIMRRRNSFRKDYNLLHKLAEHGYAIGTDYIVGHPGEDESIFQDAYKNLKTLPITHIHAFIYSKRSNTYSALMNKLVPLPIAKNRLKQVTELIKNNNLIFRQQQQILEIFIHAKDNDIYKGYDQFFNIIHIKSTINILKKWLIIDNYITKDKFNYAEI